MSKVRLKSLPDQTQPRIIALVEHSAPDPDRPKLSEETERRFEPIERSTAACYASMEDASIQLRKIAKHVTDKLRRG